MKISKRIGRLAIVVHMTAAFLTVMPFADAWTPTDNQSPGPALISTTKKRLRIAYGVRPGNYRQQILAFTPRGSSYEQVAAFARAELKAEQPGITDYTIQANTRLFNKPGYLIPLPRGKPVGAAHLVINYHAQPSWWRSELVVNVLYVFDTRHRLQEVYCHVGSLSSR